MCAVNIRDHEENFYEAEARCHEAEIEAETRQSEALTSLEITTPCHRSPIRSRRL